MRSRLTFSLILAVAVPGGAFLSCASHGRPGPGGDAGGMDSGLDVRGDARPHFDARFDAPPVSDFCDLPGSVVWAGGGSRIVPGGPMVPDVSWLHLPDGFCAHYFATVPETRQLRVSPGGDLFAASPSTSTAGGAAGGLGAIVVLPDDDRDGVADATLTYMNGLPSTQGLLFTGGYLYYQDGETIRRTPFAPGDRVAGPTSEQVVDVNIYTSGVHWPKTLDVDDSGNIFVTNGGDQGEACNASEPGPSRPFHGGILRIDGSANGHLVAKGLRNPISLRCAPGTGTCFGIELDLDFAGGQGSREKLFPVREGDDWGFPCCATANTPFGGISPSPDCSTVEAETTSFIIDHTPFGLDFEQGRWPGIWRRRTYVVLHGIVGSYEGARVVAIQTAADTGWPVASSEADAGTAMLDFATGDWASNPHLHGRPAALTFSPDGRLFLGNDVDGTVVWIAPVTAPSQDK